MGTGGVSAQAGVRASQSTRKREYVNTRDTKNGEDYWSCIRKNECRGIAIIQGTENSINVSKEGDHVHAPNQESLQAESIASNLKRKVAAHPESPSA
ncbi:hypothetical protein ANN_11174 [Periplaneta americana]|uniref:FLYWCH-type domain-containing protein n=1 Tax=Periplaneta americana TaxID=6978 RepID=A0ABQ8T605_PERAM|nr:hypothetical protein ANN_11174 [Periplaneta americana]